MTKDAETPSPPGRGGALFDLTDRVIVVTGGGKGIGLAYCRAFAAAGARVVIADIAGADAEQAAHDICASGGEAIAAVTDIADPEQTLAMAEAAIGAYGRIDALINNASLMSELERRPWHQIPIDEWDRVMAVNLRGMFLCCLAVYPHMKSQGKGKIVNISSARFWLGTPNRLHYSTSKAGVIGFTRSLAREVGDDNIAVNAITPGFTESDTQMAGTTPQYLAAKADKIANRAFKRPQVPDDLVGAVMFLVSDASDFITGQTINVDGGESMH